MLGWFCSQKSVYINLYKNLMLVKYILRPGAPQRIVEAGFVCMFEGWVASLGVLAHGSTQVAAPRSSRRAWTAEKGCSNFYEVVSSASGNLRRPVPHPVADNHSHAHG